MVQKCSVETVDWLDSTTDFTNEDQQHPVLVDFRPKRKAEDVDNAIVKLKVPRSEGSMKHEPEEVTAEIDGLEYKGLRNVDTVDIDTFIVARNKKTGECHLVETEMLFTVYPSGCTKQGDHASDVEESEKEEEEEEEPMSAYDKRDEFLARFGTSKSRNVFRNYRREIEQKIDDQVANQYTVKASAMVAKQKAADTITPNADGTSRHLAPPHNIDAKTPAEAYPLEKLVSEQELEELGNLASSALSDLRESPAPTNPGWNEFVFKLLLRNAYDVSDETLRHRRAIACYYLHLIIYLIRVPGRITRGRLRQITEELKIHPNHVNILLDRFMEQDVETSEFVRTQQLNDLMIYTGAVLWLTIEGFQNCKGLAELAAALNITPKDMVLIVVRVGGKISKSKNKSDDYNNYRARLTVPLTFPSIQIKGRRKSKGRGSRK